MIKKQFLIFSKLLSFGQFSIKKPPNPANKLNLEYVEEYCNSFNRSGNIELTCFTENRILHITNNFEVSKAVAVNKHSLRFLKDGVKVFRCISGYLYICKTKTFA